MTPLRQWTGRTEQGHGPPTQDGADMKNLTFRMGVMNFDMQSVYLSVMGVCLSSQRLVAVFPVGPLLDFILQHLKRGDQAAAGVFHGDHVVDVPLAGGHIGVVEGVFVLPDLLGAGGVWVR